MNIRLCIVLASFQQGTHSPAVVSNLACIVFANTIDTCTNTEELRPTWIGANWFTCSKLEQRSIMWLVSKSKIICHVETVPTSLTCWFFTGKTSLATPISYITRSTFTSLRHSRWDHGNTWDAIFKTWRTALGGHLRWHTRLWRLTTFRGIHWGYKRRLGWWFRCSICSSGVESSKTESMIFPSFHDVFARLLHLFLSSCLSTAARSIEIDLYARFDFWIIVLSAPSLVASKARVLSLPLSNIVVCLSQYFVLCSSFLIFYFISWHFTGRISTHGLRDRLVVDDTNSRCCRDRVKSIYNCAYNATKYSMNHLATLNGI